jgi:demethylmenaquinone methyltransferase / 2-methoxy-6-polyprenyl-1,4-benzoquinol methylase
MDVTAERTGRTLPDPENKAAFVEAMFDRIAPRYDLLNRLCTFRLDQSWRRRAVAMADLRNDDVVLDLGCGTGDLAEMAAASGATVIGVDPSAGMLAGMRQRAIAAQPLRADAARLPIRDGSATVVLSGFALRNFVSIEAVFADITRVLRPAGRVVLLEVDEPSLAPLRWLHRLHFRTVVPAVGRLLSDAEAYRYLPESIAYLPPAGELVSLMTALGWKDIRKTSLFGGVAQILRATR